MSKSNQGMPSQIPSILHKGVVPSTILTHTSPNPFSKHPITFDWCPCCDIIPWLPWIPAKTSWFTIYSRLIFFGEVEIVNFQYISFRKVHLFTKIVNIGIYHFFMKYTIPKNDINWYKEKQNKRESRSKCLQIEIHSVKEFVSTATIWAYVYWSCRVAEGLGTARVENHSMHV